MRLDLRCRSVNQDVLRRQARLGLMALFWTVERCLRPSPPHVVFCDLVTFYSRGAVIDEFVHCPTKTTNYLRRCDSTYMFDCECVLVCVSSYGTHLHVWRL